MKPFSPYSLIIELSDYLKSLWVKSPEYEPPFGHAELLSLEEFSKRRQIDLQQAIEALRQKNIKLASPKETLDSLLRKMI
ncbi:MAG: hypothetical protein NZ809_03015 [Thermodesulfovibrio sp.]|nr:hypothetical protein [Thermodesulfovibrio sp.]